MQRDTFCPGLIKDRYTGALWWLRRDADGVRRYHQRPDDKGRMPSEFYTEMGHLYMRYKAA